MIRRNNKGITLTALVITIIVLLILSGVSLSIIVGDNGIIKQAQNAITETERAEEKEKIKMAVLAAQIVGNGVLTKENLDTELNKVFNNSKEVKENKLRILPEEYEQVEYIESTGTQYIDTKYIANINTEIEIDYQFMKKPSNFEAVIYNGESGTQNSGIGIYAYNNEIMYEIGDFKIKTSSDELVREKIYMSKDIINRDNTVINREESFLYIKPSIEKGMSIFATTWSNNNQKYYVCAKVYGVKIKENDKICRNLIPCYSTTFVTNADGEECSIGTIGLYDLVERKFYTNQGTGTFLKGEKTETIKTLVWTYEIDNNRKYIINNNGKVEIEENKFRILPEEYQQVEYIESTGTQYIDTKYIANINTEIEIDYQFMKKPSNFEAIIYNGESGTQNSGIGIYAYNNEIMYEIGNFNIRESSNDLIRKKIYISKDSIKINNTLKNREEELIYIKPSIEKGMSIFAGTWSNHNQKYYVCAKVYGVKIKENDKICRNLIPCYSTTSVTNADEEECSIGTIGLYDLVEGKFYTNKGKGIFLVGTDI